MYAYRVGDGVNWTEYYHFKTASHEEEPFSFIYFGDAQNEVKTHWSRVFRVRDAPRAAFTLHAGDLIDEHMDSQWGEWYQGPDKLTEPSQLLQHQVIMNIKKILRIKKWTNKEGQPINIDIESLNNDNPEIFIVDVRF